MPTLPTSYVIVECACVTLIKRYRSIFERNFYVEKLSLCQTHQVTFIISVLGLPKQDDWQGFEASLNYRSSLRREKRKRKNDHKTFPDGGVCSKRQTALWFHWGPQWDFEKIKIGSHSNAVLQLTQRRTAVKEETVALLNRWHCPRDTKPLLPFFWFLGWYINPQGVFQFKKKSPECSTQVHGLTFSTNLKTQPELVVHTCKCEHLGFSL